MTEETGIAGCLPRIRSIYKALTKAEQKAAGYIVANPARVIHLSITELAEASGSAEATIFRLCQKAGFKGYQQLKIALACEIYTPEESVYDEVGPEDTIQAITRKIFYSISESLQDTIKLLDWRALEQAVNALAAARNIYAFGSAGSAVICEDIEYRFIRFGVPVRAYADTHMQISAAALCRPRDVVIAVSHSGANRDLIDSVDLAKKNGATVILLTSYLKSPLSRMADILLCGSAKDSEFRSEAMSARLVHLAIVDILYVGVMMQNRDGVAANVKKIREAVALKRV